jgi:predicted nucleic acid-binding protein
VLAVAVEHEARLVIMDERKGRRYAHRLGLPLTGTLAVLLLAKEEGLVTAAGPLIQQLLDQGLYFLPELVGRALTLAGE